MRLAERSRKLDGGLQEKIPACPKCKKPMVLRTARNGENAGKQFWGCSGYPECRGTIEL